MSDLSEYVELYSRDLTRFCFKLCGNKYDADDLFQDTWAKAFDKIGQYDSNRSFKSWLFAICANTYKNSGKLKYNSARVDFATAEDTERFLNSVPAAEIDLDEYFDLHDAVAQLPKKHKLVITMFYFKEFSRKEIAEILGIPEGTVDSRLNTAKRLLRRRLYHE